MEEDPRYPIRKARRNMHTLVDTFAKEANFDPNDVAFSFKDVPLRPNYRSIFRNMESNPFRDQASKCQPFQNSASVPLIFQPPDLPEIDAPDLPKIDHHQNIEEIWPELFVEHMSYDPQISSDGCHTKQYDCRQQSPAGFETAGAKPNAHPPCLPKPDPYQPELDRMSYDRPFIRPTLLPQIRSYSCRTKQYNYKQQSPAGFETTGAKYLKSVREETYHFCANSGTSKINSQSAISGSSACFNSTCHDASSCSKKAT